MAVGHRFKAIGSLVVAVLLLLPPILFWWQLAYLHHIPGEGSAVVWKKVDFGPPIEDMRETGPRLRYNLGVIPEERTLVRFGWSSPELFLLVGGALGVWGLIQLYLAWYFFRSPK